MKNELGVSSTAGDSVKRGGKGRLEMFVASDGQGGFSVHFDDYGNYGRVRWAAQAPLTRDELLDMIADLQCLADGQIDTTHEPFEQAQPEPQDVPQECSVPQDAEQDESEATPVEMKVEGLTDAERAFAEKFMSDSQ